ncbi:hypothetical protein HGB07_08175 [Candidatus Roizmanbacteria bacterium]|nr:hypothetical protein [Candidatus Roizmanbacteria bacterium]
MEALWKSIQPLASRYTQELIFGGIVITIFVASLIFFFNPLFSFSTSGSSFITKPDYIIVEVSGAVEHPGVYESTSTARLKDILTRAGGLSPDADKNYVARNFNLARLIHDQEKIYVPSRFETENNIVKEPQNNTPSTGSDTVQSVNINTGTLEELDALPGVGKTTAVAIIKYRPYTSAEELLTKKVVKKGVYEKFKTQITY